MSCVYDIKFWMLQVRKNEISLRIYSGGSARLCTLEGTPVTRKSERFDNNHYDSEPESQVRLLKFPEENLKLKKTTYRQAHAVLFTMSEWERLFFAKKQLQTTRWKNTKINCKTTGGIPSQIWPFPRVKTMLSIPLVNPFNVNASVTMMTVKFANRLLQACLL